MLQITIYSLAQMLYKTFFMPNSAETEIYPANKCLNANNCWHFNIYKHDIYIIWEFEAKKISFFLSILILWAVKISCSVEWSMKKVL